jgi:hypothetical protein
MHRCSLSLRLRLLLLSLLEAKTVPHSLDERLVPQRLIKNEYWNGQEWCVLLCQPLKRHTQSTIVASPIRRFLYRALPVSVESKTGGRCCVAFIWVGTFGDLCSFPESTIHFASRKQQFNPNVLILLVVGCCCSRKVEQHRFSNSDKLLY